MVRILVLLICLVLLITAVQAGVPGIEWQKTLGGNHDDESNSIQQTSDGGYILIGNTRSSDGDVTGNYGASNNGASDIWIVKLSDTGDIQWQKTLGGSDHDDLGNSIQQTSDSGYILIGSAYSSDGDVTKNHIDIEVDARVVKLSDTGDIQWQKTLGGSDTDKGNSIRQTSEGGYILIGSTWSFDGGVTKKYATPLNPDIWVVKLSDTGDIQWQKTLGGSDRDQGYFIQQTSDGGYILIGETDSSDGDVTIYHAGHNDIWVVKLSETGDIQWQWRLGGGNNDRGNSIQQTSDDGYILTGSTDSSDGDVTDNHGEHDVRVIKLTETGAIQWQKNLGGSDDDRGNSIQQTSDGGYILTGITESSDGDVIRRLSEFRNHLNGDVWVVKLSDTGDIQWQETLGGSAWDGGSSIQQTSDGGYILIGTTGSSDGDVTENHGRYDFWVVKLFDTGDIQWQGTLEGVTDDNSSFIQQISNWFQGIFAMF